MPDPRWLLYNAIWQAPTGAAFLGGLGSRSTTRSELLARHEPLSEPVYRLDDVWGSSGSDVYAVGPRTLLRYDGSSWRRVPGLEGRRVWGTSREDVYLLQDTRLVHGKP